MKGIAHGADCAAFDMPSREAGAIKESLAGAGALIGIDGGGPKVGDLKHGRLKLDAIHHLSYGVIRRHQGTQVAHNVTEIRCHFGRNHQSYGISSGRVSCPPPQS